MLNIESERCETVHSCINQCVVYEKFAEMTHKYDISTFAKSLDTYNHDSEVNTILNNAGVNKSLEELRNGSAEANSLSYSFAPYEFKKFDIAHLTAK